MTNLIVRGGRALRGEITPSANKNAVLPVLCATLLSDEPVTLHRVPDITDVRKLLELFRNLGSSVEMDFDTGTLRLHHGGDLDPKAAHLPLGMRSSIMLIPALLHRFGRASLEEDVTGCTLGAREIDPHIDVFRAFGAQVTSDATSIVITSPKGFSAVQHWLDYASVTTTENFVLCAATAKGRSRLTNAACEPHVQEFCDFLARMGAKIEGVGGSRVDVEGVDDLGGVEFTFADDFHEVATFLAMGAITGGDIAVRNGSVEQFPLLDRTFAKFGVEITHENGWSRARVDGPLKVREPFTSNILTKVEAAPWPYVPADLLPIFVALGVRAEGQVMFWNKVYEGALGWSSELGKFGAHSLLCDPHRLITFGGKPLVPAQVESPYIIRVAIALFMLAASIEGESTILNASPIQRAHPRFVENLNALGADVSWVAGD
ncbi:UDP-N-acetylglucosamine 1-carboxyvinyltransferase [Phenylobacterium sp.]|uniref:UDP-N-acetylglucosamine 1-carboxyvinyltransferase n=1 Tax=Phenylobacterium sp. TaxID=1871053 RepID=UPI002734164E|nr:UDP-N-acetylglucosamine 1-carboxyvinyltransferase [Phenylobacterium sp.]MDP3853592.1 UDP-N-acetylglucosamine 1-carboxyvinyltransferase [Phenylobacterium sp.]